MWAETWRRREGDSDYWERNSKHMKQQVQNFKGHESVWKSPCMEDSTIGSKMSKEKINSGMLQWSKNSYCIKFSNLKALWKILVFWNRNLSILLYRNILTKSLLSVYTTIMSLASFYTSLLTFWLAFYWICVSIWGNELLLYVSESEYLLVKNMVSFSFI
jgi:hypothetical protein